MQLQPAVVVTKSAYLKLYPHDTIETRFVVVNGCRRLAAAHKYGRTDLAIVVNDEIARDRVTLISASIAENVDRQGLRRHRRGQSRWTPSPRSAGARNEAAARLRKTQAWVSQRRALLELAPQLQTALRRGELAIREARNLARVPLEQQVARWQAAQEKKNEAAQWRSIRAAPTQPDQNLRKSIERVHFSAATSRGRAPHSVGARRREDLAGGTDRATRRGLGNHATLRHVTNLAA